MSKQKVSCCHRQQLFILKERGFMQRQFCMRPFFIHEIVLQDDEVIEILVNYWYNNTVTREKGGIMYEIL